MDTLAQNLPTMLGVAVLLPLVSFFVILVFGPKMGRAGFIAPYIATFSIVFAGILSFASLAMWLSHNKLADSHGHAAAHDEHVHDVATVEETSASGHAEHGASAKPVAGEYWTLGQFGKLRMSISYYIDSLTLVMFCMVTLIASCIHFYAMGYMHDELHEITDHEVTLRNGEHLRRPGRYPRFFQYLSLFCFSMLGLVLAGNIAMVFVFWELVGACSYFLIGFYVERKSASTAANKAFIVNRVGDFGMIIGLMALWGALGTFSFGNIDLDSNQEIGPGEQGMFAILRPDDKHNQLTITDELYLASAVRQPGEAGEKAAQILAEHASYPASAASEIRSQMPDAKDCGYGLLIVAGLGIFCGCVGKSAQFPLHVWLPDAMEGPTPVSALVHSATMVAAGVYLVGRFFPLFLPEVLFVIAVTGCITLFVAATIAITATDIKRVLAYSTISQLGYMMLSLGLGGWLAGLMHLVTHAFFKSLLFMCSGSVIHAVHTNDMRKMGGLLKKMPVTAITMLIGCLAIAGVGVPFIVGFSGYYSKDAILEQAYSLALANSGRGGPLVFFAFAAGGAAITSFYMFRMWYMTFVGKPRDQHAYDHAHESPSVMYLPLVLLSVFAVAVAWDFKLAGFGIIPVGYLIIQGVKRGWFKKSDSHGADHGHDSHGHDAHSHGDHSHGDHGHGHAVSHSVSHHDKHALPPISYASIIGMLVVTLIGGIVLQAVLPSSSLTLKNLLEQARPVGTAADVTGNWLDWTWPNEHTAHLEANHNKIVVPVTLLATGTWILGIALATFMYGLNYLNPADVRKQFSPIYQLLVNKWWFDELYDWLFIRPTHVVSRLAAGLDKNWLDWIIDGIAKLTRKFSNFWDLVADRTIVDGAANLLASWTHSLGVALRVVQTGRLRQYVMFIVVGAIALFILVSFFWSTTLAR